MMFRIFLIVLALLIILSLAGYAVHLMLKLRIQKAQEKELIEEAKQAQRERYLRIVDSVELIARAMIANQCDLSEGVLRLKPLLDVLGKKLSQYTTMWELYQIVENMPILNERKNLKRNERMRFDLEREAKEVELEQQIKQECQTLLNDIEEIKKAI